MLKDITNILNNPKEKEKYINKVSSNLFKNSKNENNKNQIYSNQIINDKNILNLINETANMIYYDDDKSNKEENIINEFKIHPLISSLYKNDEKYKINFIHKFLKSSKFNNYNSDNNLKKIYIENKIKTPIKFLSKKKIMFLSDKKNVFSNIKFINEKNGSYVFFPLYKDNDILSFDKNLNENLIISNIDDDQNSIKKDLEYGYEMSMKNLRSALKDIQNNKKIDTENNMKIFTRYTL